MVLPHLTRRRFLATTAAVSAGVFSCSPAHALLPGETPAPPWPLKLSCSSINFSSLPIEQAVARIAALGFQAIDIWSAHAGCPHLDDVLNRLGGNGLRDLLAQHKLPLYAFSVYQGGYPRYAELLGQAGGGVAVRGSAPLSDRQNLATEMKRFLESLQPELELADKYNSYLAIENHSGAALLNYLDSLKAFADLNRHPRLGIALAPYHVQLNRESVEEAIAICGKQLFFFYAWQNAPDTGQLPGIGPTDCRPWLRGLADVNFRFPVNPFMHHEPAPDAMADALRRSSEYLRTCYRETILPTSP